MARTFFIINELTALLRPVIARAEVGAMATPAPWRPPEWDGPALTSMKVTESKTDDNGTPIQSTKLYVFDAVMRAHHTRRLTITQHPIQTTADSPVSSIRDHAYPEPAQVTLEIEMSDVMASYDPTSWQGNSSKSVNAYQVLVGLQKNRTLLTLTTRLETYSNMAIEQITAIDSAETIYGLRAAVTFTEVYLALATAVKSSINYSLGPAESARKQTTDATPLGTVQATAVPTSLQASRTTSLTSTIPGAGKWSSIGLAMTKAGSLVSLAEGL